MMQQTTSFGPLKAVSLEVPTVISAVPSGATGALTAVGQPHGSAGVVPGRALSSGLLTLPACRGPE